MSSLERADAGTGHSEMPSEGFIAGTKNRLLQTLARSMPGAFTFRVWAHRMRGVDEKGHKPSRRHEFGHTTGDDPSVGPRELRDVHGWHDGKIIHDVGQGAVSRGGP